MVRKMNCKFLPMIEIKQVMGRKLKHIFLTKEKKCLFMVRKEKMNI